MLILAVQCKSLENPHESYMFCEINSSPFSPCMICEDSWGFSMIHESFKNSSQITEICPQNHFRMVCRSPRFVEIHPRIISECLQITENCPRIISVWFANHPRIISKWFANNWKLPHNHFRVVCESPWVTENHQKSHKNNQVLTLQWSTAKLGSLYSDSHWFNKSGTFSHSVKTTSVDHIAVLADSNYKVLF